MRKALFVALVVIAAVPAQAEDDLYARIGKHMAADPALAATLGKPGAEMQSVRWMLGNWDLVATVQAGNVIREPEHGASVWSATLNGTWVEMHDRYASGTQDIGYLGYSPATKQWTSIGLDSADNVVITHSAGWTGDSFIFEGDVVIVGEPAHLRQTITRNGNDRLTLTNEERMSDGSWKLLDTYRYTRKP